MIKLYTKSNSQGLEHTIVISSDELSTLLQSFITSGMSSECADLYLDFLRLKIHEQSMEVFHIEED